MRTALAEPEAAFWLDTELLEMLASSIREVQDLSPPKALKSLWVNIESDSGDNGVNEFVVPSGYRTLLSFRAWESSSLYGVHWDMVDEEYLDERRNAEGNLAQDATKTRLISLTGSGGKGERRYRLYPTVAANRNIEKSLLGFATESGTMDLPAGDPDLQTLAVYRTIEKAAAKDSRDLALSKKYGDFYIAGMKAVGVLYGDH